MEKHLKLYLLFEAKWCQLWSQEVWRVSWRAHSGPAKPGQFEMNLTIEVSSNLIFGQWRLSIQRQWGNPRKPKVTCSHRPTIVGLTRSFQV